LLNEKYRQETITWESYFKTEEEFKSFLKQVLSLYESLTRIEKFIYLEFLMNIYESLEVDVIRKNLLKLVSLPLWMNMKEKTIKENGNERVVKMIEKMKKEGKYEKYEKDFFMMMINDYKTVIRKESFEEYEICFSERFLKFLIDLISKLPTRKYLQLVLIKKNIFVHSKLSKLNTVDR
jgi:intron-binding protein aquarius